MMEKIKILGVKKEVYRSVYTFLKIKKFTDFLSKFLDEFDLYDCEDEGKNVYLDIKKKKDGYYNFNNDNYDIDLFVGGIEIILVMRTKVDKQTEISDKIFKYVEFKK